MQRLILLFTFCVAVLSTSFAQDAPKASKQRTPTLTTSAKAHTPLDVQISKMETRLAAYKQQANPNPETIAKLEAAIITKKAELAKEQASKARKGSKK